MISGVGRSAAVKWSWEGGSHVQVRGFLLEAFLQGIHQHPVFWSRFIFLNCL